MNTMTNLQALHESLTRWEVPDSWFGQHWHGWFVGLSQNRDSDALDRSNFHAALEALGGESETVQVVREGHWAVGWIEWIAVHESDERALSIQYELEGSLANYPILDEGHLSEIELEEADEVWSNCYDRAERVEYIRENPDQFEFRSWFELRKVVRGDYFAGHPSELIY
jgi:hypothetical protein